MAIKRNAAGKIIPKKFSESRLEEASNASIGLCVACGAEKEACEPDARKYPCGKCGLNLVFGARRNRDQRMDEVMSLDKRHPPGSFWSYQAGPIPSLEEAIAIGAISAETTEQQWYQLSPGMRREIVRSKMKQEGKEQ